MGTCLGQLLPNGLPSGGRAQPRLLDRGCRSCSSWSKDQCCPRGSPKGVELGRNPVEWLLLLPGGGAYFGGLGPDSRPSGFGIQFAADGLSYEGEWCAGRPHGFGRQTSAQGLVFSGSFEHGVRHGEGLGGVWPQGLPMYRELWQNGELVSSEVAMPAPGADRFKLSVASAALANAPVLPSVAEDAEAADDEQPGSDGARGDGGAPPPRTPCRGTGAGRAAAGVPAPPLDEARRAGPMFLWSEEDVVVWLRDSGLGEFARRFRRAGMRGELLSGLDHTALSQKLEVKCYGQRCRILDALRAARATAARAPCSTTPRGASSTSFCWWLDSGASPAASTRTAGLVVEAELELLIPAGQLQVQRARSPHTHRWLPPRPRSRDGRSPLSSPAAAAGADGTAGGADATPPHSPGATDAGAGEVSIGGSFPYLYLGKEVAAWRLCGALPLEGRSRWSVAIHELAALRHPSLALFLGVAVCAVEPGGDSYLAVSESHTSEGCTLRSWLEDQSQLVGVGGFAGVPAEMPAVLRIAGGIAVALRYLHSRSVFHLRLQPSCVLLEGERLAVKVTDYTISILEACMELGPRERLYGCSPWTPPEVLRSILCPPAASTDVYSFGAIAWELLARRRPYAGLSPAQLVVVVGIAGQRLPAPEAPGGHRVRPPPLWGVARRCLRHSPQRRPRFDEVQLALQNLQASYSAREDALGAFFAL